MRAREETQYTLGRVFLQEAYVIADYDRGNFSVSQALFPPTSSEQQIVAINPPMEVVAGNNDTQPAGPDGDSPHEEKHKQKLGPGGIAGIVIGALVGVFSVLAILFLLKRRSRKGQTDALSTDASVEKREAGDNLPEIEAEGNTVRELDAKNSLKPELSGDGGKHELKRTPADPDLSCRAPTSISLSWMQRAAWAENDWLLQSRWS